MRLNNGEVDRFSFVARPSRLTIDHVSLPRWSTVPTPNRDTFNITFNIWVLITSLPYVTQHLLESLYIIPFLICHLATIYYQV